MNEYFRYTLKDLEEGASQKKFNYITFFAGGGGSSCAYKLVGGDCKYMNEFQQLHVDTYLQNFPNTTHECKDIKQLGLAIEDDVVIMHRGKLEACFVAFPSSWNAGEKVGKSLTELHEPIADNEALLRASDGIMRAMCSGQSFHRYTWGISPLSGYSNHPLYEKPEIKNLKDLTFRVEHERTMTVKERETAVFLIHVDTYPLMDVLETDSGLIIQAIDSMSESVLEYKNLVEVRELLHEHILST